MTRRKLRLPDSASVADSGPDGRMIAPSAARNAAAIIEVVRQFAPAKGSALEIASGTGQHIAQFATAMPDLTWQPSDIDDQRLDSIRAWTSGLANVRPPIKLDATVSGWSKKVAPPDLIFLSNLLHLVSVEEARILVNEAAHLMPRHAVMLIYGPFRRGDTFASEGDRKFHSDLVTQDPAIGYKSLETVQGWQLDCQLQQLSCIEMPANNLILTARKL